MNYLKLSVCLLLLLFFAGTVSAQQPGIEKELKLMQAAYKKHDFLSYDVQYLYAKEKTPKDFIDTVAGHYQLHQGRYWGKLDNVECIQSDSFFISVYDEDKVIMLNSAAPASMLANMNWDSIWQQTNKEMKGFIETDNGLTKITMQNLKENSSYKQIVFWYSPADYLVKKMQYIVSQPYELPEENNSPAGNEADDEMVIIEVRFSNYNLSVFDKSIFAADKYIERNGKEFLPAKRYTDYTVLIGSPDLLN